jgi:hypothetical protein
MSGSKGKKKRQKEKKYGPVISGITPSAKVSDKKYLKLA